MISNESPDSPAGAASPLTPGQAGSALQGSAAALAARMRSLNAGVLREVALLPVLVLLLVIGLLANLAAQLIVRRFTVRPASR